MLDYKIILGLIATIIALVSYIPYIKDIWKGKTKPHAFSWFIWGLLTAIAFGVQVLEHGGAGAWATGITIPLCFYIFLFALRKGKKDFSIFDWLSLLGALLAIFLWWFTGEPLLAVILVTLADVLGFFPTFYKSFHRPHDETSILYSLSAVKYFLSLLALENYNLTLGLYPGVLVIANSLFVLLLFVRKKQLKLK